MRGKAKRDPARRSEGPQGRRAGIDPVAPPGQSSGCEKHYRQLAHCLGSPLIREVLTSFREGHLSAFFAAEPLGIGRTRFYELYAAFLRSCATRTSASWFPGLSGGNRSEAWPKPVVALARKLLGARPPAASRFVASEMLRRLQFQVDPASVRRWALAHDLAHDTPRPRPKAATRRWQSLKLVALWQLDASPHPWFLHHHRRLYPLLQDLRLHRNRAERYREIAMTPDAAAKAALREGRSVLRSVPRCPWWPYVWSQRTNVRVGSDGRVLVGTQRLPVGRPTGSRLVHCLHPDGNVTILANEPTHRSRPPILLTTNAF